MKNYIFLLTAIAILFTACQSESTKQKNNNELALDTNNVSVSDTQCYSYIKNRDTAILSYTTTNGIIVGDLSYKLYEKDSNKGMIEGEMKGDTLIVDYTFKSEGVESVRQVVMLKKANQLLEGMGDVEEKNGKFIFKNISSINFEQGIVFIKTDCNKKGY